MLLIDWASLIDLPIIEVKAMCDVVIDYFGLFLAVRKLTTHITG